MKFQKFKHENVLHDGTFSNKLGAVHTDGGIIMSEKNGGCDLENCKCSQGHWITILLPRTEDGIVEGIKVVFDNLEEIQNSLNHASKTI